MSKRRWTCEPLSSYRYISLSSYRLPVAMLAKVSSFLMRLFQALAPLIVWAELGVRGRGGEHRGKVPPRGVTLDRARLWPRNLASSPARNLAPNPHPRDPQPRDLHPRDPQPREPYPRDAHPRDLGANPARNLGSSSSRESGSGAPTRESETYPQRNTSTPFIRQSLPPGEQSAG